MRVGLYLVTVGVISAFGCGGNSSSSQSQTGESSQIGSQPAASSSVSAVASPSASLHSTSPTSSVGLAVGPLEKLPEPPIGFTRIMDPANGSLQLSATAWVAPKDTSFPFFGALDGAAFAFVKGGDVKISLPRDDSSQALVEVESSGVYLRGLLPPATALPSKVKEYGSAFRLARPITFGSVFTPLASTGVAWVKSNHDKVTVALPITSNIQFREARPTAEIDASDLVLSAATYDARSVLSERTIKKAELKAAKGVDILVSAGGSTVATVTPMFDTMLVDVVAEMGAYSRVVFERDRLLISGWVPNSLFLPKINGDVPLGSIGGFGHGLGHGRLYPEDLICDHDVLLLVDLDRAQEGAAIRRIEKYAVGWIRKGTTILVQKRKEPFSYVMFDPDNKGITASNDAAWLVPSSQIEKCQVVPQKK